MNGTIHPFIIDALPSNSPRAHMAGLSTHILDTSIGKPAANVKIELFERDNTTPLVTCHTNSDGRTDSPLIEAGQLTQGTFELQFHAGDYFRAGKSIELPVIPFLDVVVIRFGISQTEQHYHVPLLLSPYGYSTYRGS